jgi:outer membrane lipoprotein-sorting protein
MAAIYLDVSKNTYLVKAVEIEDALGNRNRFNFDRIGLGDVAPEVLFTFKPPPDAEIQDMPDGYMK